MKQPISISNIAVLIHKFNSNTFSVFVSFQNDKYVLKTLHIYLNIVIFGTISRIEEVLCIPKVGNSIHNFSSLALFNFFYFSGLLLQPQCNAKR